MFPSLPNTRSDVLVPSIWALLGVLYGLRLVTPWYCENARQVRRPLGGPASGCYGAYAGSEAVLPLDEGDNLALAARRAVGEEHYRRDFGRLESTRDAACQVRLLGADEIAQPGA